MTPASLKEMERLLLEAESILEQDTRGGVVNRELAQIVERLIQIFTTEGIRTQTRREARGKKKRKG